MMFLKPPLKPLVACLFGIAIGFSGFLEKPLVACDIFGPVLEQQLSPGPGYGWVNVCGYRNVVVSGAPNGGTRFEVFGSGTSQNVVYYNVRGVYISYFDNGDMSVDISASIKGDVSILSAGGDDVIRFSGPVHIDDIYGGGNVDIDTGKGRDEVYLTSTYGTLRVDGDLVINTGVDRDVVQLNRCELRGETLIKTGNQPDSVTWVNTEALDTVNVVLGKANDFLLVMGSQFSQPAYFNGGSGTGDSSFNIGNTFSMGGSFWFFENW